MTEKYKFYYKEQIDEDKEPLLFNLPILFNKLNLPNTILDTYIPCIFLKNNIDPKKIKIFQQQKFNYQHSTPTTISHLKLLSKFNFIEKNKFEYQLKSQTKTIFDLTKNYNIKIGYRNIFNFYDSKLYLYENHTFNEFKKLKYKNFRDFIFTELIARLYYNTPVTKYELRNDLNLSYNDCTNISKYFIGQKCKNYFKSDELPFKKYTEYELNICTGNYYYKNYYATTSKLNEHILNKLIYNDCNYFYDDNDKKFLINYWEKMANLEHEHSLLQDKKNKQISLGTRHVEYASDWRKKHIFPKLTENSYLNTLAKKIKL